MSISQGSVGSFGASGGSLSASSACTSNVQCPSGLCLNGTCVGSSSSVQACTSNLQCPSGLCLNGTCVGSSSSVQACTSNLQCPSGLCLNGICTPISSSGPNPFPITYVPGAVLTQVVNNAPVTLTGIPAPSLLCGNSRLDLGEECDDGNQFDLDGCSAYCLLEFGRCGDGIIQSLLGEQCEPALTSLIPCGNNCRYRLLSCGDAVIQSGEGCDDGRWNANTASARCRPDCSPARCGDSILDGGEACDDGNRLPGDGCDAFCRDERAAAQGPSTLPGQVIDLPFQQGAPAQPLYQQPLPAQYAQNGNLPNVPQTTESGPGAIAMMAAGAAAGYAWMRRRRS